jgi:hypothetical protein
MREFIFLSLVIRRAMANHQKFINAAVAYFAFFGSRFVGNDIQVTCGSLLDTPLLKTVTLLAIMFQATQDLKAAIVCTGAVMVAHYLASTFPQCGPYKDKVSAKHVDIRGHLWPKISQGAAPATVQIAH